MTQDSLEIFFGSIRASLGFNNNPTVVQFRGAYRQNCAGALLKPGMGANCWLSNDIQVLVVEPNSYADDNCDNQIDCDFIQAYCSFFLSFGNVKV